MVQEVQWSITKASVKAVGKEELSIQRQKRKLQYMISFQVSQENICFLQKMEEQEKVYSSDWKK